MEGAPSVILPPGTDDVVTSDVTGGVSRAMARVTTDPS